MYNQTISLAGTPHAKCPLVEASSKPTNTRHSRRLAVNRRLWLQIAVDVKPGEDMRIDSGLAKREMEFSKVLRDTSNPLEAEDLGTHHDFHAFELRSVSTSCSVNA